MKTSGDKRKVNRLPVNLKLNGAAFTARASDRGKHGGFTMMDLLVVIATTGILVVLVLPTLGFSKAKSQAEYCLSNFNQMQQACSMYQRDYADLYPPNPDQVSPIEGYNWVTDDQSGWMPPGTQGRNPQQALTMTYLTNSNWSVMAPYVAQNPGIFKCPADPRRGILNSNVVPCVRSTSMNQGVGTVDSYWLQGFSSHQGRPNVPVSGPWLTGNRQEYPYSQYATFGKASDFKNCRPSEIWVFVDDDPWTINDASMAVIAATPDTVDYCSTMHQNGCGFSFADGHVEIHKWKSNIWIHQTTGPSRAAFQVAAISGLGHQDWYWWAWHATRSFTTGSVP